jgi:cytochrome c oxidase subunit 3
MIGGSGWVNGASWGPMVNIAGILSILLVLYFWFGDAIGESQAGKYGAQIDLSYRWAMSWFIFSEVMFFGAFFGALFYARAIAMPWLGDLDHKVIWPDYAAQWGDVGPAGTVDAFRPWARSRSDHQHRLLLLSGVT